MKNRNVLAAAIFTAQLLVGASASAMIANNMPAIDEIGQYDGDITSRLTPEFTKTLGSNAPFRTGLNLSGTGASFHAIAADGVHHRLFVTDSFNNRVLVFTLNTDGSFASRLPAYMLGQSSFNTNAVATTQTGLNTPVGLAYDAVGDRLFVADQANNRVLVYGTAIISNGMSATNVLGQANFTSGSANRGGATAANTFSAPRGLVWDATSNRLFVADTANNRVLEFDAGSISDGHAADHVLGQALFTGSGSAGGTTGLNAPHGLAFDSTGSRLFIADQANNRVVVQSVSSITDNQAGTAFIGQPDSATVSAGTTSQKMSSPRGVAYDPSAGRLFVAEQTNNRVIEFDSGSIVTNGTADHRFGQTSFVASTAATTQTGLSAPRGLGYDPVSSSLYVADGANNRIVVQSVFSITDNQNASDDIGQYDANSTDPFTTTAWFTKSAANNRPNRIGLNTPGYQGTAFDTVHHRLFLPDFLNRRVLQYDLASDDTLADYVPEHVIGQVDFNGASTASSATLMGGQTRSVAYDSARDWLFVAEQSGNRVLVFDLSGGISDGMAASYVIGQANFTNVNTDFNTGASTFAAGTTSGQGFDFPQGLEYDSARQLLFVSDVGNRRVLVFDVRNSGSANQTFCGVTTNGITVNSLGASCVLGQTTLTGNASAVTATGMSEPRALSWDAAGQRLFLGDTGGLRATEFHLTNANLAANGLAAEHVLGQPNFTTATANTQNATYGCTTTINACGLGAVSASVLYDPNEQILFVADQANNRVLGFDISGGITDGKNADYVLGQPNFTTNTAFTTATQSTTIGAGMGYDATNHRLYVGGGTGGGSTGNRVSIFDVLTTTGTVSPTLNNSVTLSNATAGATSTATISFTLVHNLSSTLTVSFPSGFTVNSAATALASSSCLSGFGFTSGTLTATKTNCAGPITLGGAVVTNPSGGGTYTISWTNDDPGSANVTIAGSGGGGGGGQPSPTVTVIQPNGGESLNAGDTYSVVWSSGGTIASYRLFLSTDGGSSWTSIVSGLTGNFYGWTVPDVTTSAARLRVEGLNGSGSVIASDDGNANFSIQGTPPAPPSSGGGSPPPTPPTPPPPARTHDYDPSKEASDAPSIDVALGLVAIANPTCTPGSLIRGTRPAVYYCGIDGKRYVFHNAKVYATWFPDFSGVQFISNAALSAIPLATRFVPYHPGVRMVKLETNPKVYAVTKGAVLRLVPDEQTAADLYGANWNTKIDDIPAPFWSGYTIGSPISTN